MAFFLISSIILGLLDQLDRDRVTVVSDRIARAFNRSGNTPTVGLDISESFERV